MQSTRQWPAGTPGPSSRGGSSSSRSRSRPGLGDTATLQEMGTGSCTCNLAPAPSHMHFHPSHSPSHSHSPSCLDHLWTSLYFLAPLWHMWSCYIQVFTTLNSQLTTHNSKLTAQNSCPLSLMSRLSSLPSHQVGDPEQGALRPFFSAPPNLHLHSPGSQEGNALITVSLQFPCVIAMLFLNFWADSSHEVTKKRRETSLSWSWSSSWIHITRVTGKSGHANFSFSVQAAGQRGGPPEP